MLPIRFGGIFENNEKGEKSTTKTGVDYQAN